MLVFAGFLYACCFIKCIAATHATITESYMALHVCIRNEELRSSKLLTSHVHTRQAKCNCGTHMHMICVADRQKVMRT